MEGTEQNNTNECGVCVISSLVKYFHKVDLKTKILDDANLKEDGLSIYDFEILGNKYGIHCEAFQMSLDEFKGYSNKDFFVVLKNNGMYNHYQIIKKKKARIYIIDSVDGECEVTLDEYCKNFIGIIILVSKKEMETAYKKTSFFNKLNIKYVLLNVFLQTLVIVLTMISANYLSIFLNNALANDSTSNMLVISFLFFVIFCCNILIKMVMTLYAQRSMKGAFIQHSADFLKFIKNKDDSFLLKINVNNLYLIDHSISTIIRFELSNFNAFISSCISSLVICLYLLFIDYKIIIFCIVFILLTSLVSFLNFRYKKKNLNELINNSNSNSTYISKIIACLTKNSNESFENITMDLKKNYLNYSTLNYETNKFQAMTGGIDEIIDKVLMIMLLIFVFFFYNSSFNGDIGKVILICSLFTIFCSNIKSVLNFPSSIVEYNKMKQIYDDIIGVGNTTSTQQLPL